MFTTKVRHASDRNFLVLSAWRKWKKQGKEKCHQGESATLKSVGVDICISFYKMEKVLRTEKGNVYFF